MNFEQLTNKQLHAKCLEYGLPNVPITDTTRKVIIKKLNAAINGKTTITAKKKTPPAMKRRKTVQATVTTTVSSGDDEDDFVIKTQRTHNAETRRRQTTAVAPASKMPLEPKQSVARQAYERIIPIGFEELSNSTAIAGRTSGSASDYNSNERQRRSVSLSKTGVLTTSYSTEKVKSPTMHNTYQQAAINEDDYEDEPEEDLDDVEMESVEEAAKVYTHPSYVGYNQSNASFTVPQAPIATANKLYPNLQSAGLQHDYYNSLNGMRASQSSSSRLSNLGFARNAPTSYAPSPTLGFNVASAATATQRETIGGTLSPQPQVTYHSNLNYTPTKRYTMAGVTKRHTARAVDNDDLAASSSDDQYEAPYLSKFSRNLDNLRPEPIYKRPSPTGIAYSSPSYKGIQRRRGAYDHEDGVALSPLWAKLDQKYHVQTALYFILAFVVAVFVYVFFLQ